MIAKMKKLTFLVYHKEYDAFLKSIRDLGVVHVATKHREVLRMQVYKKVFAYLHAMQQLSNCCKV